MAASKETWLEEKEPDLVSDPAHFILAATRRLGTRHGGPGEAPDLLSHLPGYLTSKGLNPALCSAGARLSPSSSTLTVDVGNILRAS